MNKLSHFISREFGICPYALNILHTANGQGHLLDKYFHHCEPALHQLSVSNFSVCLRKNVYNSSQGQNKVISLHSNMKLTLNTE